MVILCGSIVDQLWSILASHLCMSVWFSEPSYLVYYPCLYSYLPSCTLLHMPIATCIQCIILTVMAIHLSIDYSQLWRPIHYGSLDSPQCCLVCYIQLLYYVCLYLVFIIIASSYDTQTVLTIQPSLPMLLSAMLAYSCIACLVYMAIQSAMLSSLVSFLQPSMLPSKFQQHQIDTL